METNKEALDSIAQIKNMMEKSSKFLSLSGLAGVFSGIYALIGAYGAYELLDWGRVRFQPYGSINNNSPDNYLQLLVLDGVLVLLASVITAYFLTKRKSRRLGLKMWDRVAQKMFVNFITPLLVGGAICLILLFKYGAVGFIAPMTLIFYGLALINASKYSFDELRFLGYCQLVLGIGALYFMGYGLFFWSIGFGLLHIVYGVIMFKKHR